MQNITKLQVEQKQSLNQKFALNEMLSHGIRSLGKNLLWLASAQFSGRVVRLGASVITARLLTPEIFGQVAIVLTLFELICTPTRRITSAALIRMNDADFSDNLASANTINFASCISAFVLMSLISLPLAYYYQDSQLILPILFVASSYLLLPFGMLYATVNLRNNNMRKVASANLWQTIGDGVLTAVLALSGFGIWAIIIPKVVMVFVWIYIHKTATPLPVFTQATSIARVKTLLNFSVPVSLSDLINTLRQSIDYLVIGYFMGVEALGVYFFAYNVSLGVSLGLVQSFGTAFYSHLCSDNDDLSVQSAQQKYRNSVIAITAIAAPIIILQTSLAPLYVPFVYGEQWLSTDALAVFIFLCLSGLVRPMAEAASQLLLANGHSRLNFNLNIAITALLTLVISIASQFDLTTVALSVMVTYLIIMPWLCWYSSRISFSQSTVKHS
ncbi:oligosaccharide flippase family protein [Shewanella sp. 1_MG-2023]|uniref:oligosaccharide flippase family protein n=1 Tax=unclassified Shewanella TaxID=196818 RepID=UPI0026E25029|nr:MULTISPECIES: oligosaccharide flippase family protein [unclassified Shewanella]MDO6610245.1 oligosaccharide flippase family protein [Shewanella sp. 7_MG-2023]MDO6769613.1 oligosaccharide flippase family protein [Shewanella sp. 2_MG-2023]MDO6792677.1 oligosaccharide flippase family protein [Shewanella sp. 1_MG-2023]